MEFNNYVSVQKGYSHPSFDRYLYAKLSENYKAEPQTYKKSFSIDDILDSDQNRLLDKVVNTAFSLTYRLKLYRNSQHSLESRWNELSEQIGELSGFRLGYNMNVERRKSMLEKERGTLERQMLEDKLLAWKDIGYSSQSFTQYFHDNLALKQDRKILR